MFLISTVACCLVRHEIPAPQTYFLFILFFLNENSSKQANWVFVDLLKLQVKCDLHVYKYRQCILSTLN